MQHFNAVKNSEKINSFESPKQQAFAAPNTSCVRLETLNKGTENKILGFLERVILGIFIDKLLRIIRVVLNWYLNYIFCLCKFRDLPAKIF